MRVLFVFTNQKLPADRDLYFVLSRVRLNTGIRASIMIPPKRAHVI